MQKEAMRLRVDFALTVQPKKENTLIWRFLWIKIILSDFVNKNTASHKHLRGGVVFTTAIPKSPTGKILRRLLRDQIKAELAAAKKA